MIRTNRFTAYLSCAEWGVVLVTELADRVVETSKQVSVADLARRSSSALMARVTASILSEIPAQRSVSGARRAAERVARHAINAVLAALETEQPRTEAVSAADPFVATARALVRGEPAEDLAAACGVPLASAYVVLVVCEPGGRPWDLRGDVRAVRDSVAPEHRPGLLAATSPSREHLVLLVPASATVRCEAAELALAGLVDAGRRAIVTVSTAPSRDRVAAAVDESHMVMHVARALDYPSGVYQIDNVLVESALVRSPDLAGLLARRLEPLSSSDAPLLETLQSFLDSAQDRRQAARRLHIHPNTLLYRLRRIKELTGLSPTLPKDIQTLGAAVIAWRLISSEKGARRRR